MAERPAASTDGDKVAQQPQRPSVANVARPVVSDDAVEVAQQPQRPSVASTEQPVQRPAVAERPVASAEGDKIAQQPQRPSVANVARPVVSDDAVEVAQQPQRPSVASTEQPVQRPAVAETQRPVVNEEAPVPHQAPTEQAPVQRPAVSNPEGGVVNHKNTMYAKLYGQMQQEEYDAAQIKQPTNDIAHSRSSSQVQDDQFAVLNTFNKLESLVAEHKGTPVTPAQAPTPAAPEAESHTIISHSEPLVQSKQPQAPAQSVLVNMNLDVDSELETSALAQRLQTGISASQQQAQTQAQAQTVAQDQAAVADDGESFSSNTIVVKDNKQLQQPIQQKHQLQQQQQPIEPVVERKNVAETVAALKEQRQAEAEEAARLAAIHGDGRAGAGTVSAEEVQLQQQTGAGAAVGAIADNTFIAKAQEQSAQGQNAGLGHGTGMGSNFDADVIEQQQRQPQPQTVTDRSRSNPANEPETQFARLYQQAQQASAEARADRETARQVATQLAREQVQLQQQVQQQHVQQNQQQQADARVVGSTQVNTVGDTNIRATGTTIATTSTDSSQDAVEQVVQQRQQQQAVRQSQSQVQQQQSQVQQAQQQGYLGTTQVEARTAQAAAGSAVASTVVAEGRPQAVTTPAPQAQQAPAQPQPQPQPQQAQQAQQQAAQVQQAQAQAAAQQIAQQAVQQQAVQQAQVQAQVQAQAQAQAALQAQAAPTTAQAPAPANPATAAVATNMAMPTNFGSGAGAVNAAALERTGVSALSGLAATNAASAASAANATTGASGANGVQGQQQAGSQNALAQLRAAFDEDILQDEIIKNVMQTVPSDELDEFSLRQNAVSSQGFNMDGAQALSGVIADTDLTSTQDSFDELLRTNQAQQMPSPMAMNTPASPAAVVPTNVTPGAAQITAGMSAPIPDETVIPDVNAPKEGGLLRRLAALFGRRDDGADEVSTTPTNANNAGDSKILNTSAEIMQALQEQGLQNSLRQNALDNLLGKLTTAAYDQTLPPQMKEQAHKLLKSLENPVADLHTVSSWLNFVTGPLSPSSSQAMALHQWAFMLLCIRFEQIGKNIDKFLKKTQGADNAKKLDSAVKTSRSLFNNSDDTTIQKSENLLQETFSQVERLQQQAQLTDPGQVLPRYIPLPPSYQGGREGSLNARREQDADGGSSWHLNFEFDLENMGPLQVKVRLRFPEVQMSFVAERLETLQKVQELMPTLNNNLKQLGLTSKGSNARLGNLSATTFQSTIEEQEDSADITSHNTFAGPSFTTKA